MPAEGLGSKSSEKFHKEIFDTFGLLIAEYMEVRSMLLPNGDPRRIAYAEAVHCPFSNSFLGAVPNPACQFSSEEFGFADLEYHTQEVASVHRAPAITSSPMTSCSATRVLTKQPSYITRHYSRLAHQETRRHRRFRCQNSGSRRKLQI
jgi:hypothetical protein